VRKRLLRIRNVKYEIGEENLSGITSHL